MLYNLNNIDKIFYNNKEYSSIYIKNKEVFTNEKVEKTNEFIILYGGENSSGVRFLDPKTLNELYYLDTGFPVFCITYTQNNVFALTSRNSEDMSIYLYQLNKNENNFILKDTISEINGESIESFSDNNAKQTVFYYNSYLYCFSGPSSRIFKIKSISYDFSNFCILNAEDGKIFNRNGFYKYGVDIEGKFQILDNYFLTLENKGNGYINKYKISNTDNSISCTAVYPEIYQAKSAYPLKEEDGYLIGKHLVIDPYGNGYAGDSSGSFFGDLGTANFNFTSSYSKFSCFNNLYFISGGSKKGIVEYDGGWSVTDLSDRMNIGQDGDLDSIIVSSEGNFYLKGSNIIKSYDSNYKLLITKNNSLYTDYKVIDTVSL